MYQIVEVRGSRRLEDGTVQSYEYAEVCSVTNVQDVAGPVRADRDQHEKIAVRPETYDAPRDAWTKLHHLHAGTRGAQQIQQYIFDMGAADVPGIIVFPSAGS